MDAARLPSGFLTGSSASHLAGLDALLKEAGLERQPDGEGHSVLPVAVAPLLRLRPLQNQAGEFRAQAGNLLAGPLDARTAFEHGEEIRAAQQAGLLYAETPFNALAAELLASSPPLPILQRHAKQMPEIRFFQLQVDHALYARSAIWRLLGQWHEHGTPFRAVAESLRMPLRDGRHSSADALPGVLAAFPLVTRANPLAALIRTAQGAELIVVADGERVFQRPPPMVAGWPTGSEDLFAADPDVDSHDPLAPRSREPLPAPSARTSAEEYTGAASELLEYVTDPTEWCDTDGIIGILERDIAWSTVMIGIQTLAAAARDWRSADGVWSAFRALGILQGLWEGATRATVPFSRLVDPQTVRSTALPCLQGFTDFAHRAAQVDEYEKELRRLYPSSSVEDACDNVVELRHLVHGAGKTPSKRDLEARGRRMEALRGLGRGDLNPLLDIAAIWWTATLANPRKFCAPGRPPLT